MRTLLKSCIFLLKKSVVIKFLDEENQQKAGPKIFHIYNFQNILNDSGQMDDTFPELAEDSFNETIPEKINIIISIRDGSESRMI